MKRVHIFTMVVALIAVPWALAQTTDVARSRFPSLQSDEVQQKLQLVEALLTKSPVIMRIADSGNEQAKSQASAAQKLYQRAREAISANDIAMADGHLNDALRLISEASRAVPDATQTLAQQREKYSQLTQQIEAFQDSYQRIQERKEIKKRLDPSVTMDVERIRTMVKAASALEQNQDFSAANKILSEAHDITLSALKKLVANETFVYDLRFASAGEEFRYEMERHKSYEELIPIAVATLHPTSEANHLIDNYFRQSETLKAKAQQQADKGDHKSALQTMREATDYLQKALQTVGIVVPQTMAN